MIGANRCNYLELTLSWFNDLMNLKGKLHQSRLVFSSALNNAIDMNEKHIYNTTIKYTINTIQETNIQYNNKKHTWYNKTANDNTTIKN